MVRLPSIEPGSRTLIAGRTGSGKTTLAAWLMQSRNRQRWIVLNPKHTTGYATLEDSVSLRKFDSRKLSRELDKNRFVILNFSPAESDNVFMDDVLNYIHNAYDNVGICVDELYTIHNNTRPGNGLVSILTRGRERKQTFIGLTQRPKWISRFCFSEADNICGMSLNLDEDRKRMRDDSGCDEFLVKLDSHHWLWYNVAQDVVTHWSPIPLEY